MTFNKKEYWKNRKAGKRGQGEYPVLKVSAVDGILCTPGWLKNIGARAFKKNKKRARKAKGEEL